MWLPWPRRAGDNVVVHRMGSRVRRMRAKKSPGIVHGDPTAAASTSTPCGGLLRLGRGTRGGSDNTPLHLASPPEHAFLCFTRASPILWVVL